MVMRPLLSPESANDLLSQINDIAAITVENEKMRREVYREALRTADPVNFVRIVKAVRRRRECLSCSCRYSSIEGIIPGEVKVIKGNSVREDFGRARLRSG